MGKDKQGIRDGTGSYKDSYQAQNSDVGKRQQAGEECPKKKEV